MLITLQMLQEALREGKPLFHDGDEIEKDTYDALFVNLYRYGVNNEKKLSISRNDRKKLCCEMKRYRSVRDQGDNVYFKAKCHLCSKETRIPIRCNAIETINSPIFKHTPLKENIICNSDGYVGGFITYRDLYLRNYGNNCICDGCAIQFMEKADKEAREILDRPDKFEWFMSDDNKEDWRQGLFRYTWTNDDEFEICNVRGEIFQSDAYKEMLAEQEKREEEEKQHREKIQELKRQKECQDRDEYLRVQRSNEEFLARHHLLTPTQKYIEKFCQPGSKVDIRQDSIIREALFPEGVEYEAVQKHNCMYYDQYLKTPLWRIISNKVKYNAHFKCERCGSPNDLETHHNSYEFKGVEFLKFEDLSCLCHSCHQKQH